ncbi:FAD-binding oxidoreductase [Arsenicitalea aurantiaca]|uniref:FAD-binding oxidoreductase n=1 Tax=Arsenicitalea aurantiaca TaxID=1783274 RepID=A0A433X7S0_9HYPH|nr:FAD-binding oxidoreductase [Arsenicitalea aurantiaca]RUT30105.1 FAD-binding oxidoreductase [Arsenicitalea aurantiaca]
MSKRIRDRDGMYDFAIVGAGISGAATAHELAGRGHKVVLIDQYGPASMASGWTLAGVRQSGRHPAELPLAQAAVALWQDLAERLDGPTHYRQVGNLRCARTDAEAERIKAIVGEHQALGLEMELVSGNALRAMAPMLSPEVICASFCPTDGHADPRSTVTSFVAAAERLGAETRFGQKALALRVENGRVAGIETDDGFVAAGQVVLAPGVYGNDLIAPFGYRVPFEVMSATMMRSVPMPHRDMPVIGVANGDTTLRQEVNGEYRIGGGHEVWDGQLALDPWPQVRPRARSVYELIERYSALVPELADVKLDQLWCGLIDQTVDALPVLDILPEAGGVVAAMGFSGHGFCLGPITGQILADLAEGRTPALPIAPFAMDRFGAAADGTGVELHG